MTSLEPPPRTVRPRSRSKYKLLPVVAISGNEWLNIYGETGSTDDLLKNLPRMMPTIFVKLNVADWIAGPLDKRFDDGKTWQVRATTSEREIVRPDNTRVAARISVVIHYFGWKGKNYHKAIDPVTMYGRKLDEIWPGDDPRIVKLLQWGTALRDFCHDSSIDVRPTSGGISAQFLTDRRFYPRPRRKVPAATNANVREQLPGNHYQLHVWPTPHKEFSAWYLDQHRAHHYHARTTPLPDADSLYAYGFFRDLRDIAFDEPIKDFYGLYCLDLQATPNKPTWIRDLGKAFVFSNELQHLLDDGYQINGVRAAWGSRSRDTGLARYAQWAEAQLDKHQDAPWLKPLLLSTYGILATRPKYAEAVFKLARKGEPVTVITGNNKLTGLAIRSQRKLEPRIANVLHRGMIEAATRSDSLGLAAWLSHLGYKVLSIYADAVIVEREGDRDLPILPDPWRCKQQLNHLQFINQQAFISGEMTKLPGVGRELRQYRQSGLPGRAPKKVAYEALTGKPVVTDRRI